ncbi:hypothetical protein PCANC_20797 [Puccinia coronata f. sp. avenae]|uniref:Uncharacterized protein n=1 Tax=Puccinia coronata f. sp. avenae TaxID=200324 RepID=A0A2N5U853_9BASI|nr:hypothetical protein PCANC_20797 [Puccinia coronata f. sp. avenae]
MQPTHHSPPLYNHHTHHHTESSSTDFGSTDDRNEQRSEESDAAQLGFLLNLTPLPGHVAFVEGNTVEGELQLKQLAQSSQYSFEALGVTLTGNESTTATTTTTTEEQEEHSACNTIELISQHIPLWKNSQQDMTNPPSLCPFRFLLPVDLPQCIHLPNSHGIHYQLAATLAYKDHQKNPQTSSLSIPIHISSSHYSYSNHDDILPHHHHHPEEAQQQQQEFSFEPLQISASSPTPFFVTLSQTILRHSEPLDLQIRIPPPTEELVNDKGLQLRNVRAELRRHIRPRSSPENETTSVLAISGKACRFSSTRAVFLRLRLHSCLAQRDSRGREARGSEVVAGGGIGGTGNGEERTGGMSRCERVTQTTGHFAVGFSVAVRVQVSAADGSRHDHELVQPVQLLPDRPVSPTSTATATAAAGLGKAREAAAEQTSHDADADGPAPTYLESTEEQPRDAQPSTSQLAHMDQQIGPLLDWHGQEEEEEEEEEYDGYESFSAMAGHDGPAPPTIDEDESPPPPPALDTPPEGPAPFLLLSSSDTTAPFLSGLLHHHSADPCALADIHHHPFDIPPPHILDAGRPPAYVPQLPPPPIPLPLPAPSSDASSIEPPPYAANCS